MCPRKNERFIEERHYCNVNAAWEVELAFNGNGCGKAKIPVTQNSPVVNEKIVIER